MTRGNEDAADQELSPEQVANYLRNNPDFLVQNSDLLPSPPSRWDDGDVVDMQHFQTLALRKQLDRLRNSTDVLLRTTRNNMFVQNRTHAAVLAVLNADGFESLTQVVSEELPPLLSIDVMDVVLETGNHTSALATPVITLMAGDVNRILGDSNIILRENVTGDPRLFGSAAGLVRSDALVRLRLGNDLPMGLLCLGARDPETFHPEQGTELLMFLAQVVEHGVERWLTANE